MIELDDERREVSHQGRSVKLAPLEYTFVKWMLEKQWKLEPVTRWTLADEREEERFLSLYSECFSDGMRGKIERAERIRTPLWFDERKSIAAKALGEVGLQIERRGKKPRTGFLIKEKPP